VLQRSGFTGGFERGFKRWRLHRSLGAQRRS
jgi:hypothetical protein